MSARTRAAAAARGIRIFTFRVLCEIAGKIGTYGYAAGRFIGPLGYKAGRFGARTEEWAAQRRDRP